MTLESNTLKFCTELELILSKIVLPDFSGSRLYYARIKIARPKETTKKHDGISDLQFEI